MSKLKGSVKFFNDAKGCGFLKEEESGNEYFVHITNVIDKIYENDQVSFDLAEGKKGQVAVNVEVIN